MAFVAEMFEYFPFSQLWKESDRSPWLFCVRSVLAFLLHNMMSISIVFCLCQSLVNNFLLYKQ